MMMEIIAATEPVPFSQKGIQEASGETGCRKISSITKITGAPTCLNLRTNYEKNKGF